MDVINDVFADGIVIIVMDAVYFGDQIRCNLGQTIIEHFASFIIRGENTKHFESGVSDAKEKEHCRFSSIHNIGWFQLQEYPIIIGTKVHTFLHKKRKYFGPFDYQSLMNDDLHIGGIRLGISLNFFFVPDVDIEDERLST